MKSDDDRSDDSDRQVLKNKALYKDVDCGVLRSLVIVFWVCN